MDMEYQRLQVLFQVSSVTPVEGESQKDVRWHLSESFTGSKIDCEFTQIQIYPEDLDGKFPDDISSPSLHGPDGVHSSISWLEHTL